MVDTTKLAALSIDEAARRADTCRDKIYAAINAGKLKARKSGRRTLILTPDFEEYLTNLPVIEPKSVD